MNKSYHGIRFHDLKVGIFFHNEKVTTRHNLCLFRVLKSRRP